MNEYKNGIKNIFTFLFATLTLSERAEYSEHEYSIHLQAIL